MDYIRRYTPKYTPKRTIKLNPFEKNKVYVRFGIYRRIWCDSSCQLFNLAYYKILIQTNGS